MKKNISEKWNLGCSVIVVAILILSMYFTYLYLNSGVYSLNPGDTIILKVPKSTQKEISPKLYLSKISGGKLELSGQNSWWQDGEGSLVGTNYDVSKQEISEIYSSSSNLPDKLIENNQKNSMYLSKYGIVLQHRTSWEFEVPNSKQIKIKNVSNRSVRFEAQIASE